MPGSLLNSRFMKIGEPPRALHLCDYRVRHVARKMANVPDLRLGGAYASRSICFSSAKQKRKKERKEDRKKKRMVNATHCIQRAG